MVREQHFIEEGNLSADVKEKQLQLVGSVTLLPFGLRLNINGFTQPGSPHRCAKGDYGGETVCDAAAFAHLNAYRSSLYLCTYCIQCSQHFLMCQHSTRCMGQHQEKHFIFKSADKGVIFVF